MNLGNVFILGDSYSTYEGHIEEGYSPYYSDKGPAYVNSTTGIEASADDVKNVNQTW